MSWRTAARTSSRRDGRWWLGAGAMVAGTAAAMYFLDPQRGHGRRIRVSERAARAGRTLAHRARRRFAYVENTLSGRWSHFTNTAAPTPLEGRALLDRVESELFTDRTIPHGRLSFDIEGTIVVLRGELDNAQVIAAVEAAARKVPGVSGVRSLLHVPATPAPNKKAALIVSAEAAEEDRERLRQP